MSVKRKNAQDYDPSSEVDPSLLTPSKRQRRNALSGDSIVDARHFFSGAPSAGAGPGPGWTPGARSGHANLQGPAAGYLVHWQSVQIFLHLDEDVERRSWDLLERTVQGTGDFAAGLQERRPSAVCTAMIWLAAHEIHLESPSGRPRHPLFEILSALCASNPSVKTHDLVVSTLNTFAEVIPLALIHGGIADHVRQEIELFAHGILQSYMVYADAYSLCADAFDMLTVHSPARPVAKIPALATVEDTNLGLDSYGTDLFTFAWLLLLNGKDHLMAESNDRELLRILALYCLTFVITQLNAPSRRSIGDVILRAYGQRIDGNDLKGAGNPADDWIFHAQLAKGALCHRYNLDPARYEAAESQFIQAFLMPHLIETSFFKYRSVVVLHESFPWPKYEGSMEADRHSYFHVNLEQLRNRHSATLHGKDNEVDGRVFLQSQKPSATPRRYIRNQNRATMNSVRSSPSVKGLGQILSKVRSANSNLMSTSLRPISAPSSPGPSGDNEFTSLQRRFEELLAPESFDPAKSLRRYLDKCSPELAHTIVTQIVERERAVTELVLRRGNNMERFCAMSIRLYHRISHNFLRTFDGKKRTTTMTDLLLDGQLHRALLVISFECIRFAYKVDALSFSDIFHLFAPRYLELYIIVDLVCERESWLSWFLTKRLRQIESRILEVEIWKDRVFYDFLVAARMGQDLDLDEVSKTALHYAEVLREIEDATSRKNEDPIVSLVEAVMKKVNHAAFQRLKELGSHLHLADIIIDRAWHVVEHLFGAEDQYHLLGNRNVDVALLCTIFAVARVSDAHLTFNEIRTVYQQLALGTPEALAEIPLHHDRVGDLVAFYNEIYLPAAKTYIAEEIGSKRSGKTPMHHRRKAAGGMVGSPMRPAMRTPAHHQHLASTMTPMTKKLYSFAESPRRKPSQGVPFPAGLQPGSAGHVANRPPLSTNGVLNLPMPASSRRKLA